MDLTQSFEKARIVPVFPLPNTVFFPQTSLPLHIFEPRYRAMVGDVSATDGLIAVSLVDGSGFRAVGTVGRVDELHALEDGRFNLSLTALERVTLTEVLADTPYRQALAEPRPDEPPLEATEAQKLDLLAALGLLKSVAQPSGQPIVLHEELPFDALVNSTCSGLPIEARLRQDLLEEDSLMQRQQRLLEYLAIVADAISQLNAHEAGSKTPLN